ncbi:response regulator transcription factor [Phaeospirillum tilakii]|uniref:Response regulator transcription factor n=1 Tax=Phaeospirillum tilakii TaxID=741673 RepID=A0ABW5CGS8_9PROT
MENSPRIALIDDDALFRESLILNLTAVGYAVRGWEDGEAFLAALGRQEKPDLLLLDGKMPGLNGIEVLARLRALRPELPVIFLTVLGEQVFEEAALLGGAVDFVEKSRGFTILERRIRIILGRVPVTGVAGADDRIVIGDLILDSESCRAFWRNQPVDLTVTEFAMVLALAGKAGRDVGFRPLYDAGRGKGFHAGAGHDGYRVNVRAAIKRIRGKFRALDPDFDRIVAYPGFGYSWRVDHG